MSSVSGNGDEMCHCPEPESTGTINGGAEVCMLCSYFIVLPFNMREET